MSASPNPCLECGNNTSEECDYCDEAVCDDCYGAHAEDNCNLFDPV